MSKNAMTTSTFRVIMTDLPTGKYIGGTVITDNYRTALKTVVQAHPELTGPFYHSSSWFTAHVLSRDVPTPELTVPKKFESGLLVAQGTIQNSLYAVGIRDARTGKPHAIAIRCPYLADQETWDYTVAAAAEKIGVGSYEPMELSLTSKSVVGFQNNNRQYLISRRRISNVPNVETIERLRQTGSFTQPHSAKKGGTK